MARIKYGISKVHYAPITVSTGGTISYSSPVELKGAVALTLDASGDEVREYADNIVWYAQTTNQGYTGSLEVEELPDAFRTAILSETFDAKNVLWEKSNAEPKEFALMFQFEIGGDSSVSGKRGCLMRCTASRPSANLNTKQNTITADHDTLNITAIPDPDNYVKASCDSTSNAYASWFSAVPTYALTT